MLKQEVDRQAANQLEEAADEVESRDDPLTELLGHHKMAVLIAALGTAGQSALGYVPPMYCVQFMQDADELPGNVALFSQLLCFALAAALALFVGMLVDAWGACKVYTFALLAGCIVAPAPLLYWWAHVPQAVAVPAVLIGQAVLGLLLALSSSQYLWVVELFPARVRTTGVSVAYNIGVGVFGGLGPLISDAGGRLVSPRSLVSAPAAFTMLAGFASLAAIAGSHVLARRGVLRLTHIRASPY
uniref:Major facilitator superfamily (MFS) profile domain-containing protein n=1 Tax=Zooxanthella nutricula TaxID=1333877 RepID=A0A7S2JI09_9DINO|mmetsp:Transcript_31327/g.94767  ORF Transcript_31327/g.94767 Transcript_31327/m.94767 type:complete len:244 (+) Transcript_31327:498-1229(+)